MIKKIYWLIDLTLPSLMLLGVHALVPYLEWREVYLWIGFFSGVLVLVGTQLMSGYDEFQVKSMTRKMQVVFKVWIYILLLAVFIVYLFGDIELVSRKLFLLWAVLTPLAILFLKSLASNYIKFAVPPLNTLMIGDPYAFTEQEQYQLKRSGIELDFIEQTDVNILSQKVRLSKIKIIVLNVNEKTSNQLISALTRLELDGVKLMSMNHFFEAYLHKYYVSYNGHDLDYLDDVKGYMRIQYLLKRVVDYSVGLTLLLFTFPILAYSAFKIQKESPGKLLFRQSRVGLGGKEFEVVKFRTMHENSHFDPYTKKNDARIFPYGQFMRKSRVDELPQIWNVLKGDMHILGPRTEWNLLVENYEKEIPFYHERHLVKPGISGWAQVMYPYGENTEDARQKLMYDLYYIKYWNLWLEIETIIRTIGVVLGRKGL